MTAPNKVPCPDIPRWCECEDNPTSKEQTVKEQPKVDDKPKTFEELCIPNTGPRTDTETTEYEHRPYLNKECIRNIRANLCMQALKARLKSTGDEEILKCLESLFELTKMDLAAKAVEKMQPLKENKSESGDKKKDTENSKKSSSICFWPSAKKNKETAPAPKNKDCDQITNKSNSKDNVCKPLSNFEDEQNTLCAPTFTRISTVEVIFDYLYAIKKKYLP